LNYIGSKLSLLDFIYSTIKDTAPHLEEAVFFDLFAGTGIVGRFFKNKVKSVIANDLEYYSYVLNRYYIQNSKKIDFDFSTLNNLKGIKGFIYNNYCPTISDRKYFTDENGKIIDAIRIEIEKYREDDNLYFFLLCSLLENADKVANTASVYGAYLKKFKTTASRKLEIKASPIIETDNKNLVFNEDANTIIKKIEGDILYLDPPYNERQYGANYHLLNTIAKYEVFEPKGKTGLPEYNKSSYCKKNEVINIFEDLIQNARFRYIFLSYNNEGIMPMKEIKKIMSKYGKYEIAEMDYKRYKADNGRMYSANATKEYIHILQK
jgi:adenine-specific DNA-methyltransferase